MNPLEFVLNWLSANPLGLIVVILVVGFLLALFAIAFAQRSEISLWPPKIGARPDIVRVQIGEVVIPDNYEGKEALYEIGDGKQIRKLKIPVTFEFEFKKRPAVVVGLSKIDIDCGANSRLTVRAENEGRKGFECYFETWNDSKVWGAAVSYIAIGEM